MGKIGKSFVLLTSLIAACAGCTAPKHAPGHPAAAGNRPSVAGPASAGAPPASSAPTPSARPSPAAPARQGPRTERRKPGSVPFGVTCQPAALRLALGPRVSEATQQETLVFTLTNVSGAAATSMDTQVSRS